MSIMRGVNCGVSGDGLREFGVMLPAGTVSISKLPEGGGGEIQHPDFFEVVGSTKVSLWWGSSF